MKRFRDPTWFLIFAFLGILSVVPIVQTVKEIGSDEGVVALELFNQPPTALHLRSYEKRLEETSWAGRLSRPWIQFAQFKWLKQGGEKVVAGRDGWYFFKPGLNYMVARPEVIRGKNATNDPVSAIVDFRDQLAAYGVQLLVMPVPNKETIFPDRLTSRAESLHEALSPRTKETLDQLKAAHVEVVDLFELFSHTRIQSSSDGAPPLYLSQDTHWSPLGVSLATKAVARRLEELGWVKNGQTEYLERAVTVPRLGDILKMLQAPKIEQTIAPEFVACSQVIQRDGQLYKDDPNAEVLILGDSFMRIYQTDEPTGAGFIAHLAKELKQPVFSILNDGGGATLVREELCARPILLRNKKVVIWEFVERDLGLAIKGWPRLSLPAPPGQLGPLKAPETGISTNRRPQQP